MSEQSFLRMPGATLMTRLKVYDTVTPDGQIGGTPHVHLVCTEMYIVIAGSGSVEIIDNNGFSVVDLKQNDALLFTPGTLHRLINPNKDLDLLIIMQNSGLPERGDNVVTFKEEWLATESAYAEAMTISSLEEAYQRRDRGVEGFLHLKDQFEQSLENGREHLKQFYQMAEARSAPLRAEWQKIIEQGAAKEVKHSLQQLEQLSRGDISYLTRNEYTLIQIPDETVPGFCGHLNRYFDPVSLLPEGIKV